MGASLPQSESQSERQILPSLRPNSQQLDFFRTLVWKFSLHFCCFGLGYEFTTTILYYSSYTVDNSILLRLTAASMDYLHEVIQKIDSGNGGIDLVWWPFQAGIGIIWWAITLLMWPLSIVAKGLVFGAAGAMWGGIAWLVWMGCIELKQRWGWWRIKSVELEDGLK